MTPQTIVGKKCKTPAEAAASAIRISIRDFSEGAQVVHVIIANLILRNKQWQAVVSVFSESDIDGDGKKAITFGHLPMKYHDIYDDLISEVDNLNIIEDDTIWKNIKTYLLDIYFYQAVHYEALERIKETGGGYFKEKKDNHKLDVDFELNLQQQRSQNEAAFDKAIANEHKIFEQHLENQELQILNKDEDDLNRNQREGKRIKNLVVKLMNN